MSFRLFSYYCAVCGAWAAWLGWAVGRLLAPADELPRALVHGLAVGLLVALSLSLVNAFGKRRAGSRESGVESQPLPALDPPPSALGSRSGRQPRDLVLGALVAAALGGVGGLAGAALGQWLLYRTELPLVAALGWAVAGLLIGASVGTYDVLVLFLRGEDVGDAGRKVVRGLLGGCVGGVAGGTLSALLGQGLGRLFAKPPDELVSVATAFVALGLCIGLGVGLAQGVLRA